MIWKEQNWMKFNSNIKNELSISIKNHYPIIGTVSFFNPYILLYFVFYSIFICIPSLLVIFMLMNDEEIYTKKKEEEK